MKLVGTKSNRDGIGARVEVLAARQALDSRARGELRLYFRRTTGACTSDWARPATIDKLIVRWPSGREQTLEKPAVDRVLTVEEPK